MRLIFWIVISVLVSLEIAAQEKVDCLVDKHDFCNNLPFNNVGVATHVLDQRLIDELIKFSISEPKYSEYFKDITGRLRSDTIETSYKDYIYSLTMKDEVIRDVYLSVLLFELLSIYPLDYRALKDLEVGLNMSISSIRYFESVNNIERLFYERLLIVSQSKEFSYKIYAKDKYLSFIIPQLQAFIQTIKDIRPDDGMYEDIRDRHFNLQDFEEYLSFLKKMKANYGESGR